MSADISSGNIGNIGANVRNDIQWRKAWVDRLTESEKYFDNFFKASSLPYTLFYSTGIKQGAINYQTETASLSFDVNLHSSQVWADSVEKALGAVYQGLDATKRKSDWGLAGWPGTGVTNLKPFAAGNKSFAVNVELLNDSNQVIGRQSFTVKGSWTWNNITLNISPDDSQTVTFTNVKAADITDRLTIRIASVNGASAQTAAQNGVLQIRALTEAEYDESRIICKYASFSRGVIEEGRFPRGNHNDLSGMSIIPATIWGDPVIGIGQRVFVGCELYNDTLTIAEGITFIEDDALNFTYKGDTFTLIIPNSVTYIGINNIEMGSLVVVEKVIIGANVDFENYDGKFTSYYFKNNRRGGVYQRVLRKTERIKGIQYADYFWEYSPR